MPNVMVLGPLAPGHDDLFEKHNQSEQAVKGLGAPSTEFHQATTAYNNDPDRPRYELMAQIIRVIQFLYLLINPTVEMLNDL